MICGYYSISWWYRYEMRGREKLAIIGITMKYNRDYMSLYLIRPEILR